MIVRAKNLAFELILPASLLLLWWVLSADSTSPYFPPLEQIFETFADTWLFERVSDDLIPSLIRFAAGFTLALAWGIAIGVWLGLVPLARRAADPIVDFFRAMPQVALVPVAIVFLGIGDSMKIAIIAFGSVWPVLLNTVDGVRGVDPNMNDMSRVYGLRRTTRIRRVILPAASPQIFVGARLALSIALILMVVSEMVASTNGLGYFVLLSQQTFAIPEMWSGIILLGLIGYTVNLIFSLCERRVLAWHRGWRSAVLGAPALTRPARNDAAPAIEPDSFVDRTAHQTTHTEVS